MLDRLDPWEKVVKDAPEVTLTEGYDERAERYRRSGYSFNAEGRLVATEQE